MILEEIKKELKKINKNSTIIITSMIDNKDFFKLEKINETVYKLYISNSETSIASLFEDNTNIKKIVFDNWDSSNIRTMYKTFANLQLNEFPDFSKQDFSKLKDMYHCFAYTKVKNKVVFKNHTLHRLEEAQGLFARMECEELIVDLGNTPLSNGKQMFVGTKSPKVKFTMQNSYDEIIRELKQLFCEAKVGIIDLSEVELSEFDDISELTDKYTENKKLIMPK